MLGLMFYYYFYDFDIIYFILMERVVRFYTSNRLLKII